MERLIVRQIDGIHLKVRIIVIGVYVDAFFFCFGF